MDKLKKEFYKKYKFEREFSGDVLIGLNLLKDDLWKFIETAITKAREDTLEKAYMIVYKNVLRGKGMHVDTWRKISTDLNELLTQKK